MAGGRRKQIKKRICRGGEGKIGVAVECKKHNKQDAHLLHPERDWGQWN